MCRKNEFIRSYNNEEKIYLFTRIISKWYVTVLIGLFFSYLSYCIDSWDPMNFMILFLAAVFGIEHLHHSKNRNMMEALEDFNKAWNSYGMLIAREKIVGLDKNCREENDYIKFKKRILCIKHNIEKDDEIEDKSDSSKKRVSNFFEELGYLLEAKVVDIHFMYNMFGNVVIIYHVLLKGYIEEEQKKSKVKFPDKYKGFENLYLAVEEYKQKLLDKQNSD